MVKDLNWRYATKMFNPSMMLGEAELDTIKECMRLTASSFGLQPWKFVIVKDKDAKQALLEHSWGQRQIVDCSHLIVICALKNLSAEYINNHVAYAASVRNLEAGTLDGYRDSMLRFADSLSDEDKVKWARNQCYIALGNLLNTLAVMKIDSCPMEGFIPNKYNEILNIDANYTSCVICPIGYRDESDPYSKVAKIRFAQSDIFEYR